MSVQSYMLNVGQSDNERLDALSSLYNPGSNEWCRVHGVAECASFLDVGSGNGGFTIPFAKNHPQIQCVGVDLSQEQIDVARHQAEKQGVQNIQWTKIDVYHLDTLKELYPNLFDVVHSRFVLTHLNRPTEAIDAMLRMLKPGGILLLEEFGQSRKFKVSHEVSKKAFEAFEKLVQLQANLQHSHKMDPETVRNHLEGRVTELKIDLMSATADQASTKKTFLLGTAQGIEKLAELNLSHLIQTFGYENGETWLQEMKRFVEDDSQSVMIENMTYVMAKSTEH